MTLKDAKTHLNQWVRLELTDGSVLQGELRETKEGLEQTQTGIMMWTFESDLIYYVEFEDWPPENEAQRDLATIKDVVRWKPIDPPEIIVNQDPPIAEWVKLDGQWVEVAFADGSILYGELQDTTDPSEGYESFNFWASHAGYNDVTWIDYEHCHPKHVCHIRPIPSIPLEEWGHLKGKIVTLFWEDRYRQKNNKDFYTRTQVLDFIPKSDPLLVILEHGKPHKVHASQIEKLIQYP
ncbi:hypothetical protein [Helicobacter vulpis]|uniref:hypothetical protein n=1 Tax=Helicobacter vulpis TaxID=2316076 RepID=UPI000EAD00A7|nr:hypothetical protein [Helicobacter vulpis]